MRLLRCIVLMAVWGAGAGRRYDGHQVWRLQGNPANLCDFVSSADVVLNMADNALASGFDFVDVLVSSDQTEQARDSARRAGVSVLVMQADVQTAIDEERETIEKRRKFKSPKIELTEYHTFEEIEEYLQELAATSDNVTLSSVGQTNEGRDLWVVRVGSSDVEKPAIWVDCGIHAREWITPATCLWILSSVTTQYGVDEQVTQVLDMYDIHMMPVMNPDGYVYTWTDDRLWRKNRLQIPGSDCFGVDLNRNYNGTNWGGIGASDAPCQDTYHGEYPFSEPETAAVSDQMLQLASRRLYRPVGETFVSQEGGLSQGDVSQVVIPQETVPGEILPQEIVPEEVLPQESLPEKILPQEAVPEEILIQAVVPKEILPQETVSEEILPQEAVPEEILLQETVPEEILPQKTVPKEILPQEIEPEAILPQESLAEEILPQETVPEGILPQNIAPEEILPQEMVPEEILPQENVLEKILPQGNSAVPVSRSVRESGNDDGEEKDDDDDDEENDDDDEELENDDDDEDDDDDKSEDDEEKDDDDEEEKDSDDENNSNRDRNIRSVKIIDGRSEKHETEPSDMSENVKNGNVELAGGNGALLTDGKGAELAEGNGEELVDGNGAQLTNEKEAELAGENGAELVKSNVEELVEGNGLAISFSLHSYGALWLYAYGYTADLPPDHEEMERVSAAGVAGIASVNGSVYTPGPHYTTIYPSTGTVVDYGYEFVGLPHTYIIESLSDGYGFLLPESLVAVTAEEVWRGMLAAVMAL